MSMKPFRNRGSALLVTLLILLIIGLAVASIVSYSSQSHQKAIRNARTLDRDSCLQAGLQLARSYFGRNFTNWNSYLGDPSRYNPVASATNTTPANPLSSTLQLNKPELFADLDNDNRSDVFIFIRDNADEFAPATANWTRDNDQNVIIGAVCLSETLVPWKTAGQHTADAGLPSETLIVEGILSYNQQNTPYTAQSSHGVSGSGNVN